TGTDRPGDYWVFAARTTDASFDRLTKAPPRGIHHHFARLAVVTLPGTATDCRLPDPAPEGCGCENCVTPEADAKDPQAIQEASDTLAAGGGGTVTLCPGTYVLRTPLRLEQVRSIRLRGSGAESQLIAEGAAISARSSQNLVLEHFAVTAGGQPPA